MIRPRSFGFNENTSHSNAFQQDVRFDREEINREFDTSVLSLKNSGIDVLVVEDSTEPAKPDAIFPNNWLQLRADGAIVLFPMASVNRRIERRPEIVEEITKKYDCSQLLDLSGYEKQDRFLEGTGSIVFDHYTKVGYACLSSRTDKELAKNYIKSIGYRPQIFGALYQEKEIYHTNVVMSVAEHYIIVCLEVLDQVGQEIFNSLQKTIVSISTDQMVNFAGNGLELADNQGGSLIVMSKRAHGCLRKDQLQTIQRWSSICVLPIDKIETVGGGSARCMIAENFLPLK